MSFPFDKRLPIAQRRSVESDVHAFLRYDHHASVHTGLLSWNALWFPKDAIAYHPQRIAGQPNDAFDEKLWLSGELRMVGKAEDDNVTAPRCTPQ
ncbi:hypothetical protein HRbin20_01643 [bacterium HR20]|nr:hypothetical protein HRbin20_01643 [bacterium HR20]